MCVNNLRDRAHKAYVTLKDKQIWSLYLTKAKYQPDVAIFLFIYEGAISLYTSDNNT